MTDNEMRDKLKSLYNVGAVARRIGVSGNTLRRFVNGENMTYENMNKIKAFFGVGV